MDAQIFRVEGLANAPLDAAAQFHAEYLPDIRASLGRGPMVAVVFVKAGGHSHRGWRLAAVQELAREAAPVRVNGVEGGNEQEVDEALNYLSNAEAITGQLLALGANLAQSA